MTSTTIMENYSKAFETSVLRNIAKTAGLLALGLGVLSWNGITDSLIPVHIVLGAVLGLSMMLLANQAVRAGLPIWLAAFAVLTVISVGVFGLFQEFIFPANQVLTHIIHLFGGTSAIAMSEILAVEIKKIKVK